MDFTRQIESIQFGILGDQDILDMSVCTVDKTSLVVEQGSVYDPRMGCTRNDAVCATCKENIWKCPGHFGHINLNTPIILFYKHAVTHLRLFCFKCHRLLCTKEELKLNNISQNYDSVVSFVSKLNSCSRCNSSHPDIRLNITDTTIVAQHKFRNKKTMRTLTPLIIKQVFDDVPDEDVELLGIDVTMFHPKNLVLTRFPVIPISCRPRMVTADNDSDDDLTISLIDIIKQSHILLTTQDEAKREKAIEAIKFRTLTYCDNSRGKAVHNTNHKPLLGIKERISKKAGSMRQHSMGKRCDQTARTVVGPDPTLKLDEVAVPKTIANNLTTPEYVTPFNIEQLTELVNANKASTIIKLTGTRISVANALIKRGTHLNHGDMITRGSKTFEVVNTGMALLPDDVITRNGKKIPTILPSKKHITLEIGDIVERYLQDDDLIILNRQPTLHRNSMQGMRVKIKPGKTLRVNLAIVKGFNMDFDGDEGNGLNPQTLESKAELAVITNAKHNILSAQSNKPEMVIVQDSLLGAYLMTKNPVTQMEKGDFCNCLLHTNAFERYDYAERLEFIREKRGEAGFTAPMLFGFIFPEDFHLDDPKLVISFGVLVKGALDKTWLGATRQSLIYLLGMEYTEDETASFIDNVQFLTNAWLDYNPFSVSIKDCLIDDEGKKKEIGAVVNKYFIEADQVAKVTDHPQIREARINCSLNKAKDIGMRLAKETLKPDNNFIQTVTSGSKGDFFNIAQISGLLGQQNLMGERPAPTLDNNRRTLIHYPRIIPDTDRIYESRGFISNSFIDGLNEKEMFMHAMSGREGMINTSKKTAVTGYNQRKIIKLNEDLSVQQDGTVRDAKKNILQYAFGNHGFDPSKVTFDKGNVARPVNIVRLCKRINGDAEGQFLTDEDIEDIVSRCKWKTAMPDRIFERIWGKIEDTLRKDLECVKTISVDRLSAELERKFHKARATPGDSVGIIGAQSIGERQTQTTLNTFHTAGKLQTSGTGRFEELLNMTKNLKVKTCTVFFTEKFKTAEELREKVGSSLVGFTLGDIMSGEPEIDVSNPVSIAFRYEFDVKKMYNNRLVPTKVAIAIEDCYEDSVCKITSKGVTVIIKKYPGVNDHSYAQHVRPNIEGTFVSGIKGIKAVHLDYSDGEWYCVTEGSNLKKLLAHPLIDNDRIYCNDFWEVYECFGISATRAMLRKEFKKVTGGVNDLHINLLVDKMTRKGKPMAINRYTMRTDDVGALSKAAFEESDLMFTEAALRTETDRNEGVSAAIICGNQPRVGTGSCHLLIDTAKLKGTFDDVYY